jgi:tetratricopeptide (TPR) repeat protein
LSLNWRINSLWDIELAQSLTQAEMHALAALVNAGRYAELEQSARQLLGRRPESGLTWQLLGVALRMQGKDALPALHRAAELSPDDAVSHNNLGNALAQSGRADEAASSYRRALALMPDFAEAHNNLGNVLLDQGRLDDALASYRRAICIKPDYPEGHDNLGKALLRHGQPQDAAASFQHALALKPEYAGAHNNLGNALYELGRVDDAIASYRRALALNADFAEAHNNLATLLRGQGRLDEALASYRRALQIKPDFAEAHRNVGIVQRLQGHSAHAQASALRALQIDPQSAATLAVLAELKADAGQFDQAEDLFRRAIAIEASTTEAWVGISRLRTMTADDAPWAAQAQAIAAQHLPPRKEVLLRYALGKYFDDVQEFERAFGQYQRANELTKLYRARHDRQQLTRAVDQIIRAFNQEWLGRRSIDAVTSARPVFIVGMLRSGTTLAEQILASHPGVHGAGELMFWNTAAAVHQWSAPQGAMNADALTALANDYLRLLQDLSPDALRVVDKMPGNYLHLGLIHAALPNARFIHMRRDPIDTCLSIYFQHFEAFHSYATDLADLAHYVGEYRRLMQHWRSTLPADRILEVPYEGLVNEQETWSRKLLEFTDLPWDEACIDFQRTERTVITASKWQVRQKISKSSVGRWRNYANFIGPLRHLADNRA